MLGKRGLSFALVCLLFFVVLSAWGNASLLSSLLTLAFLVVVAFLPTRSILLPRCGINWSQAICITVLGWACVAVQARVAMGFRLSPLLGILPQLLFGLRQLSRSRSLMPSGPIFRASGLPVYALSMVAVIYPLLASMWMGRGTYSPVFYNVDSAFFLCHIQALNQENQYPPTEICMSGTRIGYHYGTQLMAALLCRATGLQPHQATFLVLMPLMLLAWTAAARELSRRFAPEVPPWLTQCATLYFVMLPANTPWALQELVTRGRLEPSWRTLLDPDSFIPSYPMLNTVYCRLLILWVLAHLTQLHHKQTLAMLTVSIGTLVIFKSPVFMGLGVAIGCIALTQWWFEKSTTVALLGCASLCLAVVLLSLPDRLPMGANVAFVPLLYAKESLRWLFYLSPLYLAAWLPLWLCRHQIKLGLGAGLGLASLVPVLFCSSLAVYYYHVPGEPPRLSDFNTFQIATVSTLAAAANVGYALGACWKILPRRLWVGFIAVNTVPVILNALVNFGSLLVHPERGYSYVNNRLAADILQDLPTGERSLLVTNEFHYPADNGARELLQLQLPALFGHHFYGCCFWYGQARNPDALNRLNEQLEFRSPEWPEKSIGLAQQHHWTHLLIDKKAPHPTHIPLRMIRENERYALYGFPGEDR